MTISRTMKSNTYRPFLAALIACLMFTLSSSASMAQDTLYKLRDDGRASKVSGKVTAVTASGVTINGSEIPSSLIQKVTYGNQPLEVARAREQMDTGRYSDAIEELKKISVNPAPSVKQEIAFIEAFCTAKICLRGGGITPKSAASTVKKFIDSNGNSFHLVPAKDQFARLAFAAGLPKVAETEFKKLQGAPWREYKLKGHFDAGQMQILLGKLDQAEASFKAISGVQSNDDLTQTYKLLAQCELAKIAGLKGDAQGAQKKLEQIIKDENSDNKKLFAYLYNALGAVHQKAGRLKAASRAYLHTELLYASESEAHAEAAYRLALIWPQLEETDRANRARDLLKGRYRNTYWATQL